MSNFADKELYDGWERILDEKGFLITMFNHLPLKVRARRAAQLKRMGKRQGFSCFFENFHSKLHRVGGAYGNQYLLVRGKYETIEEVFQENRKIFVDYLLRLRSAEVEKPKMTWFSPGIKAELVCDSEMGFMYRFKQGELRYEVPFLSGCDEGIFRSRIESDYVDEHRKFNAATWKDVFSKHLEEISRIRERRESQNE